MKSSTLRISMDSVDLEGLLEIPTKPRGIVLFAHGSGSSRLSPRNLHVAGELQKAGFATLLFDLLTEREASERRYVFDVTFLARRLRGAAETIRSLPETARLRMGYFGASTGAAAALIAAATDPGIGAVVSRGGRPDLAREALPQVTAPTLLIVGSLDYDVVGLNRDAFARLTCPKRLSIVAGASHLFEEPGTLDEAATLAADWFSEHLVRTR
jgi:pimeloyl-ACP methyl ester carboxylesterase